jgi:hypothetical protein
MGRPTIDKKDLGWMTAGPRCSTASLKHSGLWKAHIKNATKETTSYGARIPQTCTAYGPCTHTPLFPITLQSFAQIHPTHRHTTLTPTPPQHASNQQHMSWPSPSRQPCMHACTAQCTPPMRPKALSPILLCRVLHKSHPKQRQTPLTPTPAQHASNLQHSAWPIPSRQPCMHCAAQDPMHP